MRRSGLRHAAVPVVCALLAVSCGKSRVATPSSVAPATTAAATTSVAVPTTGVPTTVAASGVTTPSSGSTSPSATTTTTGSSIATTAPVQTTTAPTATTVPAGPSFGDGPWPCGAGDGKNADDGSTPGVTKTSISIAAGDDAGYPGAPGLNSEMTDAMKAMIAKCNALGGINGRQIKLNYYDAALFNVGPAMQSACDDKNFFLVGEGWAFDSNQEETRLACGLPAVPAYSTSAAFAMGKDVYVGVPNPADETPAGIFAQTTTLLGAAVQHVGPLVGNFSATQELRDKVVAAAPAFGWGFSETKLEYSITGETDWTPFVKQLQDAGTTSVYWSGSCLPNLQLFAQAAKANAFNVPIIADSNHYEAGCAKANTDGALNNLYVRMAFVPFEEADVNPATKDYLDMIKTAGGDVSLLGAQATSSFMLWATAASQCGADLTRACTITNLKNIHSWTGHGLHAEDDPGANHPPVCNVMLHLVDTAYKRVAPEKRGTFQCESNWLAKLSGLPAIAAAKLDANRISQQFAVPAP